MKANILRTCLGVFLLLCGYLAGSHSFTQVRAQSTVDIPKSYGRIVGAVPSMLVFEDSSGTVRLVEYTTGHVVAVNPRN
jgi:hypothetical protein